MTRNLRTIAGVIAILGFVAALAAWLAHMLDSSQNPPIERRLGNVVYIENDKGSCSGWVLAGTHEIVTAAHCAPSDVTGSLYVDFGDGEQHRFHIRKVGDATNVDGPDTMTLTTNDNSIKWPEGFSVCEEAPQYGEQIAVIGHPFGFKKSITYGYVSNPSVDLTDILSIGIEKKIHFGKNFIQADIFFAPGNSGGPAVDRDKGCAIGIVDMIYSENGGKSVLKFLSAASTISQIE